MFARRNLIDAVGIKDISMALTGLKIFFLNILVGMPQVIISPSDTYIYIKNSTI
jgi:hypothetical protein